MLKKSLASIADQMLLSALNLGVALALIRFADKTSYGLYLQWFGVVMLAYSLIDATVGATLVARYNRLAAGTERMDTIGAHMCLAIHTCLGAVALSALGWWLFMQPQLAAVDTGAGSWLVWPAAAAYVGSYAWREFKRGTGHLLQRAFDVLYMDITYAALTVAGVAWLIATDGLSLTTTLVTLAAANAVAAAVWIRAPAVQGPGAWSDHANWPTVWRTSRWAMGGASLAWVSNHAFLYASAALLGLAATADIGAARLFLMPLSLITLGWKNVARADIGNLLQPADLGPARRYVVRSVLMVSGFGVLYLLALWLGYGWVSTHFLPANYQHLEWLIVAWSLYFVVYNVRNVGSVLLAAMGHFKPLFRLDVVGLAVQGIGIAVLVPSFGAMGLIASVALCECVLVVWMWSRLVPRLLFAREAACPPA